MQRCSSGRNSLPHLSRITPSPRQGGGGAGGRARLADCGARLGDVVLQRRHGLLQRQHPPDVGAAHALADVGLNGAAEHAQLALLVLEVDDGLVEERLEHAELERHAARAAARRKRVQHGQPDALAQARPPARRATCATEEEEGARAWRAHTAHKVADPVCTQDGRAPALEKDEAVALEDGAHELGAEEDGAVAEREGGVVRAVPRGVEHRHVSYRDIELRARALADGDAAVGTKDRDLRGRQLARWPLVALRRATIRCTFEFGRMHTCEQQRREGRAHAARMSFAWKHCCRLGFGRSVVSGRGREQFRTLFLSHPRECHATVCIVTDGMSKSHPRATIAAAVAATRLMWALARGRAHALSS